MAKNKNKFQIKDSAANNKPCVLCNPKRYLKFSLAYVSYESSGKKDSDIIKLWERLRWISHDTYENMLYTYRASKDKWFELLPIDKINKKIPENFRETFPTETNEKYAVLRVYPAGRPNGTANPRIIGMIKHTVFYVFFLDWDGKLYNH